LEKSFGVRPFQRKAFTKPFGKDLRKTSLCRNFEKRVLKKKSPPCGGRCVPRNYFQKPLFKAETCRNHNKGIA
jgi:hypothetical protein